LALQKFPDDEELLYSLGRCLWKSGKSKELEKVKKELERLGKEEYVKLLTALELTSKEDIPWLFLFLNLWQVSFILRRNFIIISECVMLLKENMKRR